MERPIVYNLLRKDELVHEVLIREAKPLHTVPELRSQLRQLSKDIPADEILKTNLDSTEELNI